LSPLYLSPDRGERISKSSGRKRVNLFKSPYEEGLGRSILPNKMEKSEDKLSAILLNPSPMRRGLG
jgi:hypothetical protein